MKTDITSRLLRINRANRRWAALVLVVVLIALQFVSIPAHSRAATSNTLNMAGPVVGPENLDPAQVRDLSSVVMFRQIYRGLMLYDNKLNPVPEIAESVDLSPDGLTYDFTLRGDAKFQNGAPITSQDVSFSLNRAVDPDTTNGDTSLLAGPAFLSDIVGFGDVLANKTDTMTGIHVISDSELTITLAHPQATFLMKLAAVPASIVDNAQVSSDADWSSSPIGSGPFKVDTWQPDVSLDLEAYDGFFGGAPSLDAIHFRLGASALQSFNLYQAGQVDLASISLSDINRVADPDGDYVDQLVTTPLFALGYIALNPNVAPLDDPYVRAALQLIMPREKFVDAAFDGWVNQANGLIPDQMLARSWQNHLPATSVDAAKAALAKSKYGSADKVPTIRIYAAGAFMSLVLKDVAEEELGLKIEVYDMQWTDMLDRLGSGDIPAYELYWASDYPDPAGILFALFGTGQPDNYIGYSDPKVDKLLAEAAAEPDVDVRAAIYDKVNATICASNVVLPIYTDVDYTVVQPYVHNLVITPMGIIRLETVQLEH